MHHASVSVDFGLEHAPNFIRMSARGSTKGKLVEIAVCVADPSGKAPCNIVVTKSSQGRNWSRHNCTLGWSKPALVPNLIERSQYSDEKKAALLAKYKS